MLIKRFVITTDLALRFLSRPATLTIAAVPIVLWPVKRLFFARISLAEDLVVLLIVHVVVAVGVFAWKFVQAEHVMANESKLDVELEKLDGQEQDQLKRLIHSGKMPVGPPLFGQIAAKTHFIMLTLRVRRLLHDPLPRAPEMS
jgi:hypothetical protein